MSLKSKIVNTHHLIFARPLFARFNTWLQATAARCLGMGHSDTGWSVQKSEHRLMKALGKKRAGRKPVVFDVGANKGQWATALHQRCPQARLISFEPNPSSFARLKAVAQKIGSTAEPLGLSSKPGRATIYDDPLEPASVVATLNPKVYSGLYKGKPTRSAVRLDSLDRYCSRRRIGHIDFLKIDVEGHELQALQGAKRMVKEGRISAIQFELNQTFLFANLHLRDFADLLPGWSFYRLLSYGLLPLGDYDVRRWEQYLYQNILVLPPGASVSDW